MGVAAINGVQNTGITAACAKHFIGYSDPKSGWDRTPAEIPDQALREFFLPPFRDAVDAGVKIHSKSWPLVPLASNEIILSSPAQTKSSNGAGM